MERIKPSPRTAFLAYNLEKLTMEVFQKCGYNVNDTSDIGPADAIAEKGGIKYCIEVKASTSLMFNNYSLLNSAATRIVNYARTLNAVPILVIFALVPEERKGDLSRQYDKLEILDISNLLYIVNGTELQDDLISLLPFSVEFIETKENNLGLGFVSHSDKVGLLLQQLDNCISGREDANKFEDICFELLKYLYADDLCLWHKQPKSNDGLYRFDLLCRIKDDISKSFWRMMETYFHSKYIIFEFKNYTDHVTQKEIYTTERYLYNKALRNVAIIIAKNGFDENSIWAAKGSLRENGKLILLISVSDLLEMVNKKRDQEDSSEVFLSMLDKLLIQLEK